jgi:hypothetical protein
LLTHLRMADLNRYMPENFVDWGPEGYGEGLTRTWTGILSTVKDWLPLVGQVPGKKGVSLVAGVCASSPVADDDPS